MKYVLVVKENFTDKYTGAKYKKGNEIIVDETRGEELLVTAPSLVELKETIEEETASTGETTNELEGEKIENPETIEESAVSTGEDELEALKEKAKELGVKVTNNMKKETILKKIEEAEIQEEK